MTQEPNPKRRWPTFLLIASLAVNLIVIGSLVGFAIRGPESRGIGPHAMPNAISLLRATPDNHRDGLRDAFRAQRDSIRGFRENIGTVRGQFLAAVESDPLDREKLKTLLEQHAKIEQQISSRGHIVLLEVISGMNAEDRKIFAENAREMTKRRGADRKRK